MLAKANLAKARQRRAVRAARKKSAAKPAPGVTPMAGEAFSPPAALPMSEPGVQTPPPIPAQ